MKRVLGVVYSLLSDVYTSVPVGLLRTGIACMYAIYMNALPVSTCKHVLKSMISIASSFCG